MMGNLYDMSDNSEERWGGTKIMSASYTCGYCGMHVTSDEGMPLYTINSIGRSVNGKPQGVFVCTNCHMPTGCKLIPETTFKRAYNE